MSESSATKTGTKGMLRRFWPVLLLAAGASLFFYYDVGAYLSFHALRQNREDLLALVAAHGMLALVAFAALYALAVALSLPLGAFLTVTGGFLFGPGPATIVIVIGATTGAAILFLAARTAFADLLHAKAGPWLKRMEAGFQDGALSYLLVLRLIPLFPFFAVNIVPALLGVPLGTYVVATLIGIIPGTYVYASVGDGLGALFDAGQDPNLGIIFEPRILAPLAGLALLALLPVGYKMWRRRR